MSTPTLRRVAQTSQLSAAERDVIAAFRRMSAECQRDTQHTVAAWADAFPRRAPASLTLVGGVA